MEQQSPLAGGGRCARTACATTPVNGYPADCCRETWQRHHSSRDSRSVGDFIPRMIFLLVPRPSWSGNQATMRGKDRLAERKQPEQIRILAALKLSIPERLSPDREM
jgi:hypothetical protein